MSNNDLYVMTLGLEASGPLFEIHLFYNTLEKAEAAYQFAKHDSGPITDEYGTTIDVDTKILFARISSVNKTAEINASQGITHMRAQASAQVKYQAEMTASIDNVVTLTPVEAAFNPKTLKGKSAK